MNYEEALAYIHSAPHFKGTRVMERIARLFALLNGPQLGLKYVHVAGTNGKGSTVRMIAGVLQAAGYRTGMFISPYVLEFRERIQINGKMIAPEELCKVVRQVRKAVEQMKEEGLFVTEFEIVTACGILYFAQQKCDIVVLEVGLGGRLDATNIIPCPEVAVITKIAKDHTAVLGHSLPEITAEKCGIIKGGDVVCYPRQDPSVEKTIAHYCKEKNAQLHVPAIGKVYATECTLDHCLLHCPEGELFLPLGGPHQIDNAATALEAIGVLREKGWHIPFTSVSEGFRGLFFPARLQTVCKNPHVLVDGAHNPDGMGALLKALDGIAFTAIFTAMKDKDYTDVLMRLKSSAHRLIFCPLDMERAARPEDLLKVAAKGEIAKGFADAYTLALQGLQADEKIVVCGSLYLASVALAYFKQQGDFSGCN